MIYDICTYNGEADLFDLRYNILKNFVDEFVVLEFNETFSGNIKPYYFEKEEFINWPKVKYFKFAKEYEKYSDLAKNSPNTIGAKHWQKEFAMKEMLKDCLTHLKDEDIVFVGDADEIIDPKWIKEFKDLFVPVKLKLQVYTYYLNNKSSEEFWGTLVSPYYLIKNKCLNHLRTNSNKIGLNGYGWHFTSMANDLRKKLTDSYTAESYATPEVLDNLETNIKENKDFLGRPFTYTTDESEWPQFLKDNREKYKHLCK